MTTAETQFEELEALLEEERVALLAGDLESIGTMLTRKEALVAEIIAHEWKDRTPMEVLQGKLQRNQKLLDAAMDGIRSVAVRLAALRQVREALDTYDAHGRKRSVKRETGASVERRA